MTKLILGLGNPGDSYKKTRHNAGFWVLDRIAEQASDSSTSWERSKKCHADFLRILDLAGESVLLAKPTTYMNNSGRAASELVQYYKIHPSDILIIHDEMDLPPGALAFSRGGRPAGHHGLESVYQYLSTEGLDRLRIGIGRSEHTDVMKTWVLSSPSASEQVLLESAVSKAASAVSDWISTGLDNAMNRWNHLKKA